MSIYEYDEEEARKYLREEAREEGYEAGQLQMIAELVRDGLVKKEDILLRYGVAEDAFERAFNALPN